MKSINNFITEKLRINKNIKTKQVEYFPKNYDDLKKIITKRALDSNDGVLDLNDIDISEITDLSYLFENINNIKSVDMNDWDTSKVTDIHGLFWSNKSIEEIYINDWNTNNIESFYGVFYDCENLKTLDLTNWKFDKCKETDLMFANCSKLDLSFANKWDLDLETINSGDMFRNCNNPPKWYKLQM